jgi:hypothetical protein
VRIETKATAPFRFQHLPQKLQLFFFALMNRLDLDETADKYKNSEGVYLTDHDQQRATKPSLINALPCTAFSCIARSDLVD